MTDKLDLLSSKEFTDFFRAINGVDPFPWQSRLLAEVVEKGTWPDTLKLPTASGKTALIDIAIFLLALSADGSIPSFIAARRIFFVVDRRTIVDEAYLRATRIADALEKAISSKLSGVVERVARRLDSLSGNIPGRLPRPLIANIMRGGIRYEPDWSHNPLQPCVCVSTVDQVGSRLLFRGYGVSEFASPIHAGLIAYDSLILLDEAHLSGSFQKTLRQVSLYCGPKWSEVPIGPQSLRVVSMSATAEEATSHLTFGLADADIANPVLARRLGAKKLVELMKLGGDVIGSAEVIAERAVSLASQTDPQFTPTVCVVVNRVAHARSIYEQLANLVNSATGDVILLTGRSRPIQRDRLVAEFRSRLISDSNRDLTQKGKPLFVVATQCIEAGADFDFTAMISEIAPISSLIQRAGRLDRLGRMGTSPFVILAPDTAVTQEADPIYGIPLSKVVDFIENEIARSSVLDFGHTQFSQVPPEKLVGLNPVVAVKPTLRPADIDLLAQTSPRPSPDVDIAPFLHGTAEQQRDVSLVWRLDIPKEVPENISDLPPGLEDVLLFLPPSSIEVLQVPVGAARAWLAGKNQGAEAMSDVEGARDISLDIKSDATTLVWRRDSGLEISRVRDLRPGDIILLNPGSGGCDRFGWNPDFDGLTEDLAQTSLQPTGKRFVRVSASSSDVEKDADDDIRLSLTELQDSMSADHDAEVPNYDETLQVIKSRQPALFDVDSLGSDPIIIPYHPGKPTQGIALIRRKPLAMKHTVQFFSDDGEDSSLATLEVDLPSHSEGVRKFAKEFSRLLSPDLVNLLEVAGYQHDVGKAEPRMQAFLNGGRSRPKSAPHLAKGLATLQSRTFAAQARSLSQFTAGLRHEVWSVSMLDTFLSSSSSDLGVKDVQLLRWLVGSHHGRGRPWFSFIQDPHSSSFMGTLIGSTHQLTIDDGYRLSRLEGHWVETFWTVVRRYGWWGCAYLEAVLRLADHRRSESELLGIRAPAGAP